MELLIVGVVVGIIIAAVAMKKKPPKDPEAEMKRKIALLDSKREELETRHQQQWMQVIDGLPIVNSANSTFLHSPIYDCVSDEFELPCQHHTYDSHSSSVHGGMLYGFGPRDEVRQILLNSSHLEDEVIACIDAGDHAYLIYTDTLLEPGSKVYRFVRTAVNEYHVYGWRSGMRPSAGKDDPPYHVSDVSRAPKKWIERMNKLCKRWASNSNYQSALRRCSHR